MREGGGRDDRFRESAYDPMLVIWLSTAATRNPPFIFVLNVTGMGDGTAP